MGKQQSLIRGISILGIAGLICKVVGVLYKVPLAARIGPEGMGVYHQVFPTYNLLLTISSAGIPVAISRMVAGFLARGDRLSAHRVFRIARAMLLTLGAAGTALMMALSPQLAKAAGSAEAAGGFLMIAPSLLLVCAMSAYRGFMQGRRRMVPTAVSQLIEQVGKVLVALPLAVLGMQRGGYAMGAAGALLGTSMAELVALVYMMIDKRRAQPAFDALPLAAGDRPASRVLARELTLISIPITLGACIVPLAGTADSFMLVNLMSAYMPKADALIRYGVYTGLVITLINVPTALAMATAANLVPSIGAAYARQDGDRVRHEAGAGLRIASVIGFPASVGLSMLAEPILLLLFGGRGQYTREQLLMGADLLRISSLTILLFTQVQASSGILQGLHRQRIPMYTLAFGVALKVLVNYTLVRIPAVGISGAPYASLLCYAVSLAPNLYAVAKYADMRLNWRDIVLRPALSTGAMALALAGIMALGGGKLATSWLWLMSAVALAGAVYVLAAVGLGAVRREELPGIFRKERGRHV